MLQNTALYEHLISSGFSDFESASCLQQAVTHSAELSAQTQQKVSYLICKVSRLGCKASYVLWCWDLE